MGNMYPFRQIFIFIIVFIISICSDSCTKKASDNPFDNLDPAAWAPQNLNVEDVNITEKKLTWTYGDQNIEGFKLDRKKGSDEWQMAFYTFSKETRYWNDSDIIPDSALKYSYRLYAYSGKNNSDPITSTVSAAIPSRQICKLAIPHYFL